MLGSLSFKKNRFTNKQAFFDALHQADHQAIRYLARLVGPALRKAGYEARLSKEDIEELLNDTIVITISKIQEGKVHFMEYSPSAYARGVARKLIANRIRTKKPRTEDLEKVQLPSDFNPEQYLKNKEQESLIGRFLAQLAANCRTLIRLKYFDQLKDREIVEQALTPYNSAATIKSKRNQCLKKLARLVEEAGGKQLIDY